MSQPLQSHTITVQGDPVLAYIIHGKNHIPIQERLRQVQDKGYHYSMLDMTNFEMNGRFFVKAMIGITDDKGVFRTYFGVSEIRLDPKIHKLTGADLKAPIEMAQTRAERNALENAGFGITGEVLGSKERPTKKCQTVRGDDITAYMYGGNAYSPVSERIRLAFAHEDTIYTISEYEAIQIGGRWMFRITIKMPNHGQYIGDAEVRFGANPNSPDGSWPAECAEPSALGRALGFARVALIPGANGIASAEEMALSNGIGDIEIVTTEVKAVQPPTFPNTPSLTKVIADMQPHPVVNKPIAPPDPPQQIAEVVRQAEPALVSAMAAGMQKLYPPANDVSESDPDDEEF